jgi:hypothetical protein
MTNLHFYDLFNEKSEELFRDLVASFPNIEQFRHWRSALNLMKNLDQKGPQRLFSNYMTGSLKEYILTKNEDFFLVEENISVTKDTEYWNSFFSYLRNVWKTLSTEDKEVIWKYFHILVVLSDKCTQSV